MDALIFSFYRGHLANSVLESTDLDTDVLKNEGESQVHGGCSQTAVLCKHLVHLLKVMGLGILTVPGDLTQELQILNKTLLRNPSNVMGLRDSFWGGGCILRLNCGDGSITL